MNPNIKEIINSKAWRIPFKIIEVGSKEYKKLLKAQPTILDENGVIVNKNLIRTDSGRQFFALGGIEAFDKLICYIIMPKNAGKTKAIVEKIAFNFLSLGRVSLFLRNTEEEIEKMVPQLAGPCGKFGFKVFKNKIIDRNGKLVCIIQALSTIHKLDGAIFEGIKDVFCDEFLSKGTYPYNLYLKLCFALNTAERNAKDMRIYFFGNAISVDNPYFNQMGWVIEKRGIYLFNHYLVYYAGDNDVFMGDEVMTASRAFAMPHKDAYDAIFSNEMLYDKNEYVKQILDEEFDVKNNYFFKSEEIVFAFGKWKDKFYVWNSFVNKKQVICFNETDLVHDNKMIVDDNGEGEVIDLLYNLIIQKKILFSDNEVFNSVINLINRRDIYDRKQIWNTF